MHSITFLYKVGPGVVKSSFGLHVARLAQLPSEVIASAAAASNRLEGLLEGIMRKYVIMCTTWLACLC